MIEWDPKVGPATIVSLGGAVAVLVTLGVAWGSLQTKLEHVLEASNKTDRSINTVQRDNKQQDEKIATQSAQISGIQSTVNFMVPSIQRIEARIESIFQTTGHRDIVPGSNGTNAKPP